MASTSWTIIVEESEWRVGRTEEGEMLLASVEAGEDTKAAAAEVAAILNAQGYRGEAVLLALESTWCLVAEMPGEVSAHSKNHAALGYELEQFLPLAAEEIVADFAVTDKQVLGVAAAKQRVQPVVENLESVGVFVQAIVPAAILATQHVLEFGHMEEPGLLIWQHGGPVEIVEAGPQGPLSWLSAADQTMLAHHLRYLAFRRQTQLEAVGYDLSREIEELCSGLQAVRLGSNREMSLDEAVVHGASGVLAGNVQPWFDFAPELLGGIRFYRPVAKLLWVAGATAAVFLLVLAGVLHVRAGVYADRARSYEQMQVEVFKKNFPGQALPVGIRSRLKSEQVRLSALRGEGAELPIKPSGLMVLHDVLAALPSSMRLRILEIRIDGSEVYLEGEVRSLGDGDVIAGQLRQAGFLVEPPQLARLADQGMSFRLVAQWSASPSPMEARQ